MEPYWWVIRLSSDAYSAASKGRVRIERDLEESEIKYYIPWQHKTIIHHRSKKRMERRFPLIRGYAFVAQMPDIGEILSVDNVYGVLTAERSGKPFPLPVEQIERVKEVEELLQQQHNDAKLKKPKGPKWGKLSSEVGMDKLKQMFDRKYLLYVD